MVHPWVAGYSLKHSIIIIIYYQLLHIFNYYTLIIYCYIWDPVSKKSDGTDTILLWYNGGYAPKRLHLKSERVCVLCPSVLKWLHEKAWLKKLTVQNLFPPHTPSSLSLFFLPSCDRIKIVGNWKGKWFSNNISQRQLFFVANPWDHSSYFMTAKGWYSRLMQNLATDAFNFLTFLKIWNLSLVFSQISRINLSLLIIWNPRHS